MTKLVNPLGEQRHTLCRYGVLTEAYEVSTYGKETPTNLPACLFPVPTRSPPALARSWGGLVEYERDCAKCLAYSPL